MANTSQNKASSPLTPGHYFSWIEEQHRLPPSLPPSLVEYEQRKLDGLKGYLPFPPSNIPIGKYDFHTSIDDLFFLGVQGALRKIRGIPYSPKDLVFDLGGIALT